MRGGTKTQKERASQTTRKSFPVVGQGMGGPTEKGQERWRERGRHGAFREADFRGSPVEWVVKGEGAKGNRGFGLGGRAIHFQRVGVGLAGGSPFSLGPASWEWLCDIWVEASSSKDRIACEQLQLPLYRLP